MHFPTAFYKCILSTFTINKKDSEVNNERKVVQSVVFDLHIKCIRNLSFVHTWTLRNLKNKIKRVPVGIQVLVLRLHFLIVFLLLCSLFVLVSGLAD